MGTQHGRQNRSLAGHAGLDGPENAGGIGPDRKSTRLNSSHLGISNAVFCLKKKMPIYMAATGRRRGCWTSSPVGLRRTSTTPTYFFFNDSGTSEIYTLSLRDALPI